MLSVSSMPFVRCVNEREWEIAIRQLEYWLEYLFDSKLNYFCRLGPSILLFSVAIYLIASITQSAKWIAFEKSLFYAETFLMQANDHRLSH